MILIYVAINFVNVANSQVKVRLVNYIRVNIERLLLRQITDKVIEKVVFIGHMNKQINRKLKILF
jgi:hypothetical protein